MPLNASELLSRISRQIFEWQGGAFKFGITVGEEAITEFIGLELCKYNGQVSVKQWTKKRESKNGADFDLILANNGRSFRFAVQAKRLYDTGNYEHLSGSKATTQHARLLEYVNETKHDGFIQAVPIYCLYNCAEKPPIESTWRYKIHAEPVDDFGCTVCPFSVIGEVLNKGLTNSFGGVNGREQVLLLKDLPELAIDLCTEKESARLSYSPDVRPAFQRFGREKQKHDASLIAGLDTERLFPQSLLDHVDDIYASVSMKPRFSIAIYDPDLEF